MNNPRVRPIFLLWAMILRQRRPPAGRAGISLRLRILAFGIGGTFLISPLTLAQTGRLTVESKPPGATVFVDSLYAGTTPLRDYETTAAPHTLRLVYPGLTSWLAVTKTMPIEVRAGQEVRYDIELGSIFTILSTPSGATVLFQEHELGTTPLLYRSESPLSGMLLLNKNGFEAATLPLAPSYPFLSRIELKPLSNTHQPPEVLPPDYLDSVSPRWATYVAASTMILSGVLSAYWKDRANRDFDRYGLTKDPALLASTQSLDRRSGIAITISHLSFAALAYLLLSE